MAAIFRKGLCCIDYIMIIIKLIIEQLYWLYITIIIKFIANYKSRWLLFA